MSVTEFEYGKLSDGTIVKGFTIKNKNGLSATVIERGAALVSLMAPDKDGNFADVVLGLKDAAAYENNNYCLGATVGRNANRIAGACFDIDGIHYELVKNNGENNLHTHPEYGYHRRNWEGKAEEGSDSVIFFLEDDGKLTGMPGIFNITVTYRLTDEDELLIAYHGVGDTKTIANCTNHSYFNLAGHDAGSVYDHEIRINASRFSADKEGAIPTGEWTPVEGTPMDLRKSTRIGEYIDDDYEQLILTKGYDHNYCIDDADHTVREIAQVTEPVSGRVMTVLTDLPGVQFYTANWLEEERGKDGVVYHPRDAFCLETQYFPNSINQEGFERPVVDAGAEYKTSTIYKFSVLK